MNRNSLQDGCPAFTQSLMSAIEFFPPLASPCSLPFLWTRASLLWSFCLTGPPLPVQFFGLLCKALLSKKAAPGHAWSQPSFESPISHHHQLWWRESSVPSRKAEPTAEDDFIQGPPQLSCQSFVSFVCPWAPSIHIGVLGPCFCEVNRPRATNGQEKS